MNFHVSLCLFRSPELISNALNAGKLVAGREKGRSCRHPDGDLEWETDARTVHSRDDTSRVPPERAIVGMELELTGYPGAGHDSPPLFSAAIGQLAALCQLVDEFF